MGTEYSSNNWANKALVLMDEVDSLIRWGCVSADAERYTPAAKAFWEVCNMLADERRRLEVDKSGIAAAVSAMTDEQRLELFGNYCTHCGCPDPTCQCWNDE
jgi:hypothetical protein